MLSHAQLLSLLSYEPATGVFVSSVVRKRVNVGDVIGNRNSRGYMRACIDGKHYYLHRLAWFYVHAHWPPDQIDHKNGKFDDNRIDNLRLATEVTNGRNRKRDIRNTTGKTGVFQLRNGKFRADIKLPERRLILGTFECFSDAVEARIAAEKFYFKEFRRIGS